VLTQAGRIIRKSKKETKICDHLYSFGQLYKFWSLAFGSPSDNMSTTTLHSNNISIQPLLKQLYEPQKHGKASADEIAAGFSLFFEEDRLSEAQAIEFLTLLSTTSRDKDADVIAACAAQMREVALPVNLEHLRTIIEHHGRGQGSYHGGLCDIVGTGGSQHQTYNISTTASLVASSFLLMSKHGNKAQTSVSGAADILACIEPTAPNLLASNHHNLPRIYEKSPYAFLYAPNFHPGMKNAARVRKQMVTRTIFNLLGPLAHPIEELVEARVVGVADTSLGAVFAEALRLSGTNKAPELRKAMVVAGQEGLDEISCAGVTDCWMVQSTLPDSEEFDAGIEHFELQPKNFGFPTHPLIAIRGGGSPVENAKILIQLLEGKLQNDDPILQIVLMNAAAMLVVSGLCDSETSHMGEGDNGNVIGERGPGKGRWKEGVRRARYAVESGAALRSLQAFTEVSDELAAKKRGRDLPKILD